MGMTRRFLRNRRGAAALEFAICAGVLIAMSCGMAELYFRFDTSKRITMLALQTADVVAQSATHTTASLSDIRAAAKATLDPLESTGIVIDIASIGVDAAGGAASVLWRDSNGIQILTNDDLTLAKDFVEVGGSTIFVGVKYTYTPPLSLIIKDAAVFEHTAFSRPRLTRRIALNGKAE